MNISCCILLIAISFTVLSCSKDNKKYCWECIMKRKQISPIAAPEDYMKFEECNKTSDEINTLLKDFPRTSTLVPNIDGVEHPELSTVENQELTCTKK